MRPHPGATLARPAQPVALRLVGIIGDGLQWPLRGLRIFDGFDLVIEIPVELLESMVSHYLVGHHISRVFSERVGAGWEGEVRKPLAPIPPPVYDRKQRAALRQRRRSRKR